MKKTLLLLALGFFVGGIIVTIWPSVVTATQTWDHPAFKQIGNVDAVLICLLICLAGAGIQNTRWFQSGMFILTMIYFLPMLGGAHWSLMISFGPVLVGSLYVVINPPPKEDGSTFNGLKASAFAVISLAVAFYVAKYWQPILSASSVVVDGCGITYVIAYCIASVGFAANWFKGESLWYRGLKAYASTAMLVVNAATPVQASVIFNTTMLTFMVLAEIENRF